MSANKDSSCKKTSIGGQAVLEERVALRLVGRAFHKELPRPGVETRVGRKLEAQRLVLLEERFQEDHGRLR